LASVWVVTVSSIPSTLIVTPASGRLTDSPPGVSASSDAKTRPHTTVPGSEVNVRVSKSITV
jgi:hypothetical protein